MSQHYPVIPSNASISSCERPMSSFMSSSIGSGFTIGVLDWELTIFTPLGVDGGFAGPMK